MFPVWPIESLLPEATLLPLKLNIFSPSLVELKVRVRFRCRLHTLSCLGFIYQGSLDKEAWHEVAEDG